MSHPGPLWLFEVYSNYMIQSTERCINNDKCRFLYLPGYKHSINKFLYNQWQQWGVEILGLHASRSVDGGFETWVVWKSKTTKLALILSWHSLLFSVEGILTRLINTLQHQLLCVISCALRTLGHIRYKYKSHPGLPITQHYITT